eukprot:PhM_4_TR14068/c0_g1_i1/m.9987
MDLPPKPTAVAVANVSLHDLGDLLKFQPSGALDASGLVAVLRNVVQDVNTLAAEINALKKALALSNAQTQQNTLDTQALNGEVVALRADTGAGIQGALKTLRDEDASLRHELELVKADCAQNCDDINGVRAEAKKHIAKVEETLADRIQVLQHQNEAELRDQRAATEVEVQDIRRVHARSVDDSNTKIAEVSRVHEAFSQEVVGSFDVVDDRHAQAQRFQSRRTAHFLSLFSVRTMRISYFRQWLQLAQLRKNLRNKERLAASLGPYFSQGLLRLRFNAWREGAQRRAEQRKRQLVEALSGLTKNGLRQRCFARWAVWSREVAPKLRLARLTQLSDRLMCLSEAGRRRRAYLTWLEATLLRRERKKRERFCNIVRGHSDYLLRRRAYMQWTGFVQRLRAFRSLKVASQGMLLATGRGVRLVYYKKWAEFHQIRAKETKRRRLVDGLALVTDRSKQRRAYVLWNAFRAKSQELRRKKAMSLMVLQQATPLVLGRRYLYKWMAHSAERQRARRVQRLVASLGLNIDSVHRRAAFSRWRTWSLQCRVLSRHLDAQNTFLRKGELERARTYWRVWTAFVYNRRAAQFAIVRELLAHQPEYAAVLQRLLGRLQRIDRDILLLAHDKASKQEAVTLPDVVRLNVLVQEGTGMTVRVSKLEEMSAGFQTGRNIQLAADMDALRNHFASTDSVAEGFVAAQIQQRAYVEGQEESERAMLRERWHLAGLTSTSHVTPPQRRGDSSTHQQLHRAASRSPASRVVRTGHEASAMRRWRAKQNYDD